MKEILTYFELESLLGRANCQHSAAENHGIVCGLLSVSINADAELWLGQVFPERDPQNALQNQVATQLAPLMESVREQLQDSNLAFFPLLLSDDEDLADRVEAMQEWMQGFLLGISLSGVQDFSGLPDDTQEVLNDFVQIGGAGEMDIENQEESEGAYAHIVEYIRMGVLLVSEELQPSRSSTTIH